MEISDELIGCYVEGTCTKEELRAVREYLINHPEEYDRIICLIDNNRETPELPQSIKKASSNQNTDYLDFSLASAAFAPFDSKMPMLSEDNSSSNTYANLNKLLKELESI